jgi:hypothetical protein
LNVASAKKVLAIMASKISAPEGEASADDWPGRSIDHAQYAAKLAARRELLGQPELPRNSGTRRTESKKALLKAIKDAGGKW